ncbi:hypothetical protein R4466_04740 [Acinetobacter baumannii]|nr:hypothetical protein [Acinetobacter baumannii]
MLDLSIEEILLILKEIKKIPILRPANGMGGVRAKLPSPTRTIQWETNSLVKINILTNFFSNYGVSIDAGTINLVLNTLRETQFLNTKINQINDFSEGEKYNKLLDEISNSIDKTFNYMGNMKIDANNIIIDSTTSFTNFYNLICKLNNIGVSDNFLQPIIEENSIDFFYEIINKIVELNNNNQTKDIPQETNNIFQKYISEKYKLNKEILEQERKVFQKEKQDFEEYKKSSIEKLESARSKEIITAFKKASKKTKCSIIFFYIFIFTTFIAIITLLFCRVQESKKNVQQDFPYYFKEFYFQATTIHTFDIQSFLYFLSLIISLTGLLAFLIKEKNRLTAQRDYFERCDTELNAFITYVSDFEPEQIRNLKIDLAKNYFTGGNFQVNKTTNQDESLTPENLKQILDILTEVSKK